MSDNATQTNRVAEAEKKSRPLVPVQDFSDFRNLLDTNRFEHLWRISQAFAKSDMVPDTFKNKPENCFVSLQMALRLKIDPFMLMQNTYVVYGRPGFEAKLAIALVNASGVFEGRIKYSLTGEGMKKSCTASAKDAQTGEVIQQTVTMEMAKNEGWMDKKGSKWLTIPDLMLQYRSAMFLIRLHCPEVIMGLLSSDELEDIAPPVKMVQSVKMDDLINPTLAETATEPAEPPASPSEEWPEKVGKALADIISAESAIELSAIRQRLAQEKENMGHDRWMVISKALDKRAKEL